MLWTLFVVLLLVWMIFLIVGIGGLAIHLLLVAAVFVLVSRLVGRVEK